MSVLRDQTEKGQRNIIFTLISIRVGWQTIIIVSNSEAIIKLVVAKFETGNNMRHTMYVIYEENGD